ncbi:DUF5682 family protein [Nonomuraea sp. NPDC046570]|uniref:DUF5682 family protein n=1 Tax=Nonomuraea sp. NPDC046570 TaxID=3155255 RepID=UPI0033E84282
MTLDPVAAVEELVACRSPYLVGVRHHSPVLAAAMPALLEAAAPDAVLVELPGELEPWLEWLGSPGTTAPVALAVASPSGERLGFYPFADFSPELAAIRWARARGVPVHAIDLTVHADDAQGPGVVVPALLRHLGVDDPEELWDRLVEAPSYGAAPERIRRAALAVGWAMRQDAAPVGERDLARESWMRRRIAEIGAARPAAIVGAFHAPALLQADAGFEREQRDLPETVTALVPYAFALLDSRSGYPAGIRDPGWQQAVFEAGGDPEAVGAAAAEMIARVCATLRADGHVAGVPDGSAAYRLARDLAALRGLPAPGRRELIDGLESALSQGEPLGRARAVARAAERVLVGDRHGTVAPEAPRAGLRTHVEALLTELRLPGPNTPATDLRLDPLRSPLDRRRHITLSRMAAAGIAYAEEHPLEGVAGADALGRAWTVEWRPLTSATLEIAALYGPSLPQAATGRLRLSLTDPRPDSPPRPLPATLERAAECALPELAEDLLHRLTTEFPQAASLTELVTAHHLVARIGTGAVPGLPDGLPGCPEASAHLLTAAVAALEGLSGATHRADAASLGELVRLILDSGGANQVGAGRLVWALRRMAAAGAPMAQGAAAAALVVAGAHTVRDLGLRLAGWADAVPSAATPGADTAARLAGALVVAAPLLEASADLLATLTERVHAWPDDGFLARLPALREAFDALSPASRQRLLDALELDDDLVLSATADDHAHWAVADAAGRAAALALDPHSVSTPPVPGADTVANPQAGAMLGPDRWRLILGREPERLEPGSRAVARALDDLYGRGRGEGSRGAGASEPYPSAREWVEELEELFGGTVREEVVGRAAARGRSDALGVLDPERVTASVDLLQQVLALAGALPEARLARLRPLIARLVAELTRRLATRMRPALAGLTTPRPTGRPGGPLDLGRTLRRNLHTARRTPAGVEVIAQRPVFRTRSRRSADWHVHICVDVSGSMERSTVYSAVVAAILHGVPALSVRFITFSTEVVDLSARVSDPLALLLEVSVGGGTDIGAGLRYARERLTVPRRSIVAVVTDFDEGVSTGRLLAEVRALAETGAHLLGLAALDDSGKPVYNRAVAERVAAAGMPVAALSPTELATWIAERVRA